MQESECYVHMHVYVYMYIYMYVYVCVAISVYMYMYMLVLDEWCKKWEADHLACGVYGVYLYHGRICKMYVCVYLLKTLRATTAPKGRWSDT